MINPSNWPPEVLVQYEKISQSGVLKKQAIELLAFLLDTSYAGGEITEKTILLDFFSTPSDDLDKTDRARAAVQRLRSQLTLYYAYAATGAAADALSIDIPKGQYRPRIRPRSFPAGEKNSTTSTIAPESSGDVSVAASPEPTLNPSPDEAEGQKPPGGAGAKSSGDNFRPPSLLQSRPLLVLISLAALCALVYWMLRPPTKGRDDVGGGPPQPPPLSSVTVEVNHLDGLAYSWLPPGTKPGVVPQLFYDLRGMVGLRRPPLLVFLMGCSAGDMECYSDEKPAREVTMTKGFWMSQTEVTQEAYQRVIGKNPSKLFRGAKLPVTDVGWAQAQKYCQNVGMRLPTEAEWESAARAGTNGSRYGDLDKIAWYWTAKNSGRPHEVRGKHPNAWGLYDMLGNVWEWTADWYAPEYSQADAINPTGPPGGEHHAMRGGSSADLPDKARASSRTALDNAVELNGYSALGFRCAGSRLQ